MSDKTRQKYYDQLCGMGFPEVLAAAMAEQVDDWGLTATALSMREAVCRFSIWQHTKEGHEFWSLINQCLLGKK